jgi:hypothetical protein
MPVKEYSVKNKWDEAIQDAKTKLSALRKTLKYFEEMKKKGMPWPGDPRRLSE